MPDNLEFIENQTFKITNDAGDVIADTVINRDENHYISAQISLKNVQTLQVKYPNLVHCRYCRNNENTKIPVKLTIDKQTKAVGEFNYVFVPGDLNKEFDKVS